MSKSKFTPGPWETVMCQDMQLYIEEPKGDLVAHVMPDLGEESQAFNAELIAAAPELYRLLDALLVYVIAEADEPHSIDWRKVYVDLGIETKAALAKARGEG